MEETSMNSERFIRRPPDNDIPRQFLNESVIKRCVGIVVIVLVPILHLDGVKLHIDHIAIRAELRHLYPVADAHHVLRGELHARDQRQDRVLEDEEQDGGHRTEPAQQQQR